MSLTPGTKLSHYEISAQLGKGGMGEVYKAKDQKLGRDVAIKVLPEEFAKDAERVARFQREAKLLASLNHPNIASIYGLEESEGTHFLVLELIDGDTLADRIKSGPIPVEESLKLALQIAEALEAAHEKGVIHRDLKPANIKVTLGGKVKVLDFGLAKAFAGEQAEVNLSNSPTLSVAATQQGIILGTAGYMSPEQARGKSVDKRTDTWAFGVVFYEMLTGSPLFAGEDVSSTLARVLEREPDFSKLPPNLHPRIGLLLEECVEKDPMNRCRDIGDARIDIQKVLVNPSEDFMPSAAGAEPQTGLRRIVPWMGAFLAIGIIAGYGLRMIKTQPDSLPNQVISFEYSLQENQKFEPHSYVKFSVSPDGSQFAYSASDGLYLRSMNELKARLISGANEVVANPFFSYDGKWIGYISSNEGLLKKVSTFGGPATPICKVGTAFDAFWNTDDTIIFAETGKGIMQVSAAGGVPKILIPEKSGPMYHPRFLPGGKSVIYTIIDEGFKVVAQSLESDERKIQFQGESAYYVSTGHLVYKAGNRLFAVPFDPKALKISDTPFPIELGEAISYGSGMPQFDISDSGTLVYTSETASETQKSLVWVYRDGTEERLSAEPRKYDTFRISPDGKKVALEVEIGGDPSIWIWDLERKDLSPLTERNSLACLPHWTHDGKWILFSSLRTGNFDVYRRPADGSGKDELFFSEPANATFIDSISNDGTFAICGSGGVSNLDISVLQLAGERSLSPLLHAAYHENNGRIHPKGRWLAYESNQEGQAEIYVCQYPDVNSGRKKISTGGGRDPLWSPDGKELFYRGGDSIMAVPIETEPDFSAGKPKVLFSDKYAFPDNMSWDIHPDGNRFLMVKGIEDDSSAESTSRPKIIVIVNWLEGLKQQVPGD